MSFSIVIMLGMQAFEGPQLTESAAARAAIVVPRPMLVSERPLVLGSWRSKANRVLVLVAGGELLEDNSGGVPAG